MEWRPSGWSVCLPLSIFPCTIKSRSSLLAPAHPGGLRKNGRKTVVLCVWSIQNSCVRLVTCLQKSHFMRQRLGIQMHRSYLAVVYAIFTSSAALIPSSFITYGRWIQVWVTQLRLILTWCYTRYAPCKPLVSRRDRPQHNGDLTELLN